jgi:hypothetical protein
MTQSNSLENINLAIGLLNTKYSITSTNVNGILTDINENHQKLCAE